MRPAVAIATIAAQAPASAASTSSLRCSSHHPFSRREAPSQTLNAIPATSTRTHSASAPLPTLRPGT